MRRRNVNTNEKEEKKTNISKKKLFSLIISLLLILVSITMVVTIGILGILPFKYMVALILGMLLLNVILGGILLKTRKGKRARPVINTLQTILVIVETIIIVYVFKTYNFMNKMTEDSNTKKENYSVVVLKDSKYNKIKDLKGKVIEYYNNELDNSELAIKELKKVVDVSAVSHPDVYEVANTLLDAEVDAILLEESQKNMLDEELEGFKEKTRVIYTFAVDITVETIAKDVSVSSEPFIVYISGIDTYGEIASVSRSDVNMVAVVNPKTYQVLLVNIPRDYYVQLHGTSGKRDKLTHAGMYGVEMSVKTIEDLLKIDINYYLKVNFTSLETIVDAIGGIEVYSEYDFVDHENRFSYKKGINKLNGPEALAFARERKAFADGDRMRGKNQQAVLKAIVAQASKPSIITKVDKLLKSLSDKFQTNMEMSKITDLVKLQISKMPTWNISTVSLTGGDGRALAYSSGNTPLYVMLPSQNSITDAMNKIKTIVTGGILEGAYDSVTGNIYTPKAIELPVVEEPEEVIDSEKEEDITDITDKEENPESDTTQNEGVKDKENNDTTTTPDTGKDNEQKPEDSEENTAGKEENSNPSTDSGNVPSTDTNTNIDSSQQPESQAENN